jgi:HPt (histidine-containing phosphotransfer) domain-containing protein
MSDQLLSDKKALENLDGDLELLQSIREVFLETIQETHEELTLAKLQETPGNFLRIVHSLKSSAGSVGAEILSKKARKIEELIRTNKGSEVPSLIPDLIDCFDLTVAEIRKTFG